MPSWDTALTLRAPEAEGGVRDDSRLCKRQLLLAANPLQSQVKDERKRKKHASLATLLPLPFLL